MNTKKTGDKEMINEIKFQIRVVKHQIQATENLIKTFKIKSYADQLSVLEAKLEQLEASLAASLVKPVHPFEKAGLGKAPFRYVGASENHIKHADGSMQPAGTCDYCGTGISLQMHIKSSDSRCFIVGCDCVQKLDWEDNQLSKLAKAVQNKHRSVQAKKRTQVQAENLETLIEENKEKLMALPHPKGWETKTYLDYILWLAPKCEKTGKSKLYKQIKKAIAA